VEQALTTVGLVPPEKAKVVQISNTLHLKEVLVSEAYLPQLRERPDLEIVSGPHEMSFDAAGNLPAVHP
jgi:hypothetical protein